MKDENILMFIAIWDEEFGPKLVDIFPEEEELDFNTISSQLFRTYQFFYKDKSDNPFTRFLFHIPIVNISKKASVCLDWIRIKEADTDKSPFIVVILLPDYYPDESMKVFENIIQNISMEYVEKKAPILKKYFHQVNDKFIIEQKVQDSDVFIDEDYLLPNALEDFKTGLLQYQQKEYDRSYILLRKAHLKFESEQQSKLLMETTFLIGTILMQKNRYLAAIEYFQNLETLATQLEHYKYYEKALYLGGFCDYQRDNHKQAYVKFAKLGKTGLNFISKFQYCIILGKVLADARLYDEAVKSLEKSLELSEAEQENPDIMKKRAETFLDLGHINVDKIYHAGKLGELTKSDFKTQLANSTRFFKDSIELWKKLEDYKKLIEIYQLIASNNETLGKMEKVIKYYEKALEYAELSNDIDTRFKLLEQIIQIYEELGYHDEIIEKVDIILHEIAPIAYLDLYSVAGLHKHLGESFIKLRRDNDALSELIVALNVYNKLSNPVPELLNVLQTIIEVYEQRGEEDHVKYYRGKYKKTLIDLEQRSKIDKKEYQPLEVIEEVWIFTKEGVSLFSYTPKLNTMPQLISSFLMAMINFSSELKVDELKTIKIGTANFSYYKDEEHPIFIVGRTNIKIQSDIRAKTMKAIHESFWMKYESQLENFDGDSSKFDSFIEDLKSLNP